MAASSGAVRRSARTVCAAPSSTVTATRHGQNFWGRAAVMRSRRSRLPQDTLHAGETFNTREYERRPILHERTGRLDGETNKALRHGGVERRVTVDVLDGPTRPVAV